MLCVILSILYDCASVLYDSGDLFHNNTQLLHILQSHLLRLRELFITFSEMQFIRDFDSGTFKVIREISHLTWLRLGTFSKLVKYVFPKHIINHLQSN